MKIKRRTALPVRVSKPGYAMRIVRMPFKQRRQVTVRLYRDRSSGRCTAPTHARTQAHGDIKLRPPFKVVWSRGIGTLIEFPAVITGGVAYIGNYKGTIYALNMRDGKVIWKYDPPGRQDGLVARDRRRRPRRSRHGRHRPRARPQQRAPALELPRRLADRVVAGRPRRDRLLRRLERARLRARPEAPEAALEPAQRLQDHVERRDRRRARSTSATTAAGCSRSRTAHRRLRFSRSVNGRIYGTPAVAAGRVFVPSSTGNSLTAFTTSGRYLWRVRTGGYVYSSPAVWAGRVFFGSYNGRFYSVSAKSGRVLWTVGAGGPVSGAAVVVGGVAYAGSTWSRITGVDAKSGRVVLSFPHGEYVPVSGNGRRLLLHGYSRVWAVEPKA